MYITVDLLCSQIKFRLQETLSCLYARTSSSIRKKMGVMGSLHQMATWRLWHTLPKIAPTNVIGLTCVSTSPPMSSRGRLVVAAKQLNCINHSNCNKSFTSIEYELLQVGQPCDPLTFFRRTHDPEKKINVKWKEMSEKIKAMKEAVDRGETNDTPEEIFYKVRNAGCSGKRRRKAYPTNYSLYQKKEEEIAKFKKETGPKATKKWLNEYLVKVGMPAMELLSEDDAEDDDEDADMHGSQIHDHRDAFEGSDREAQEEDVEAFGDDQEEGGGESRQEE
ncbi:hypothetical protein MKW92_032645 [Papaver armeniacum]|nr:hypothetical protein MKW92_032645 [Papaver armeniacum]